MHLYSTHSHKRAKRCVALAPWPLRCVLIDATWWQSTFTIHNLQIKYIKIKCWSFFFFFYIRACPRKDSRYIFASAEETSSGESCAKLSKLLLFSHSGNMKGRISQSVEYSESDFGWGSFAPAVWYLHGTYRHTWVSTHKKSTVKRRRHKSANTLMQTDIYTLPLFSYTHANTVR